MQTARRARTSVSETADDDVTAFGHRPNDLLSGDLGVRCLNETLRFQSARRERFM